MLEIRDYQRKIEDAIEAGNSLEEVMVIIDGWPDLNGHHSELVQYLSDRMIKWTTMSGQHHNLTDYGNAERLVQLYGPDILYNVDKKLWGIFNGKRWVWDRGNVKIAKLAKKTARSVYHEAGDEDEDKTADLLAKHAKDSERSARLDSMIKLAESENGIVVDTEKMDTDPWLVNCRNVTVDMRTGDTKPHDRADHITEMLDLDYDPAAKSPDFESFLDRIFGGDAELIAYIQRAIGYSCCGDESEQVFFFCYGGGFNGKSTLLNAIGRVMGNYSYQVPPTAFMVDKQKGGGPDEAIAGLKGKRFVIATELEDGQRLASSLIKRMTGGEELWCEKKFEHGHSFKPTHKLWLSGNHEPVITDTTNSIWNRLKKIPFTVEIPEGERKKGYSEYLAKEHGPAILAWIVAGCVAWYKNDDLGEPDAVKQAVAAYRDLQDILHEFLNESCVMQRGVSMPQKDLYADYKRWCTGNDVDHPLGKLNFRTRILEKGMLNAFGNRNAAIWRGIRLLTEQEKIEGVNSVNPGDLFTQSSNTRGSLEKNFAENASKINTINTSIDPSGVDALHDCQKCGENAWTYLEDAETMKCKKCGDIVPAATS